MRKLCWTLVLGTSAWGVTALAAPEEPGKVVTRQAWFTIPFQIEPTQRADRQPVRVQLHMLDPISGQWRLAEEAAPEDGGFQFRAQEDGEYSFMVRTFDRAGRQRPQRPPSAELIVVVDTAAPQIELTAERGPAGEVTARWKVEDPHVDPASFSISYQGLEEREGWHEVSVPPLEADVSGNAFYGEAVLPVVRLQSGLNLRAEVRDKAGNPAVTQARVEGVGGLARVRPASERTDVAVRTASDATASTGWDNNPAAQNVAASAHEDAMPGAVAWEANRQADLPYEQEREASPYGAPGLRYASDGSALPSAEVLPQVTPSPIQTASRGTPYLDSAELIPPATPTPRDVAAAPPATGPSLGSPTDDRQMYDQSLVRTGEGQERYQPPTFNQREAFVSHSALPAPQIHAPATGPVDTTGGEPPRMVCSTKFELEYDIESVGPHGVRRVELWGTRDSGLSWRSYGVDEDGRSPLVATVEGEGMYGFLIAVESGAGVGGEQPRPGEKPAIWVGVDKTAPSVELLGVGEGTGQESGCLVFDWRADDPFLPKQAVTLLYTEHPGGPWTRIAAGLENTGHYAWTPDRELPEAVFLRLEVRDEAGNVKAVDAPQAVSVRALQPQGRVRNVRPLDAPSARRLSNPYFTR